MTHDLRLSPNEKVYRRQTINLGNISVCLPQLYEWPAAPAIQSNTITLIFFG